MKSADAPSEALRTANSTQGARDGAACPPHPRACIVIPYFGRWPRWFHLFLKTCAANPSVHWLFVSDTAFEQPLPPNVRLHALSLEALRSLACERLNMEIELSYPFKVCDFRPAFGHIFEEHLGDYAFWGWGDVDVFFGDILKSLRRLMDVYDVISPRPDFLAGEFTLIRNAEPFNSLYRKSRDYEMVFRNRRGWDFEEYGFFHDRPVDSMTHVLLREMARGHVKGCLYEDLLRTDRRLRERPFQFYWHDGRLIDLASGETLLLYHFLDRKKNPAFQIPDARTAMPNGFLVSPNGVDPAHIQFRPPRTPWRWLTARAEATCRRYVRRLRQIQRVRRSLQPTPPRNPAPMQSATASDPEAPKRE
jgi:hypothetical protein